MIQSFQEYCERRERIDEDLRGMARGAYAGGANLARNIGAGAWDAAKGVSNLATGLPTAAIGLADKALTGDGAKLATGIRRAGRGLVQTGVAAARVAGAPVAAAVKARGLGSSSTGRIGQFYGLGQRMPSSTPGSANAHHDMPLEYEQVFHYIDSRGMDGQKALNTMLRDIDQRLNKIRQSSAARQSMDAT